MNLTMDPDVLSCVICTTSTSMCFPELIELEETTTTLLKLLGLNEEEDVETGDPMSVPADFEELPYLLCSTCLTRIQEIHDTWTQLKVLQNQIIHCRAQMKEEILRSYNTKQLDSELRSGGGSGSRATLHKADVVRIKIVQRLNAQNPVVESTSGAPFILIPPPIFSSPGQGQSRDQSQSKSQLRTHEIQGIILKELRIVLQRIEQIEPKVKVNGKATKKSRAKKKRKGEINRKEIPDIPVNETLRDEELSNNDYEGQDEGDEDVGGSDPDYECPDADHLSHSDKNSDETPGGVIVKKSKKRRERMIEIGEDGLRRCPFPGCTSRARYSEDMLRVHNRRVHEDVPPKRRPPPPYVGPLLPCTYPGCTSSLKYSKKGLTAHVKRVHKGEGRSKPEELKGCPEPHCTSRVRYTESRLLAHIHRVHSNIPIRPKPVQCDVCGKVVSSQKTLLSHQRKHTGERFTCHTCGAQFRTLVGLSDHEKGHVESRPFLCQLCGKGFLKPSHLEIHMMRHSGEAQFVCRVCPRKFRMKYDVRNHEQFAHAKELKLEKVQAKCKTCGKVYSTKTSLRTHWKMVHKGECRYHCPECPYKTDRRHDLQEHLITHSTHVPFHCDQCGKGFKLKRRLDEHMRTHKDNHPNECSVCHKRFSLPAYLLRHQLAQHKGHVNEVEVTEHTPLEPIHHPVDPNLQSETPMSQGTPPPPPLDYFV